MSMDIGSDTNANVQEDDEKKALNEDTKLNVPIPEHKRESLEVGDISHKNENAMMDVAIGFQFHDLCNLDPTEGMLSHIYGQCNQYTLFFGQGLFDVSLSWYSCGQRKISINISNGTIEQMTCMVVVRSWLLQ